MTLNEVGELLCSNGMPTRLLVQRYDWGYAVRFDSISVAGSGVLRSAFGSGSTPEEATADYASQLGGQRLAHSFSRDRKYLTLPSTVTVQ